MVVGCQVVMSLFQQWMIPCVKNSLVPFSVSVSFTFSHSFRVKSSLYNDEKISLRPVNRPSLDPLLYIIENNFLLSPSLSSSSSSFRFSSGEKDRFGCFVSRRVYPLLFSTEINNNLYVPRRLIIYRKDRK